MRKHTKESVRLSALNYTSRAAFKKGDPHSYKAAKRMKIVGEVCSHMEVLWEIKWNTETVRLEALKYTTRAEFQYSCMGAYKAAKRLGILDEVCSHMQILWESKWTPETVRLEALKYTVKNEFKKGSRGAYVAAKRFGILDEVCNHMQKSNNVSVAEQKLFNIIQFSYPTTQILRDREANIINKSFIKGFDIDMFIPELNLGIEFDGKYHHSFVAMRKSKDKIKWSDDDIRNYHNIKDQYFLSKGIKILHIKEEDWIKNKEDCIKRCFEFLSQTPSDLKEVA